MELTFQCRRRDSMQNSYGIYKYRRYIYRYRYRYGIYEIYSLLDNNKWEKINQKDKQGVRGTVFNKIVKKRFSEELTFEERPERGDGMRYVDYFGKKHFGNSKVQELRHEYA